MKSRFIDEYDPAGDGPSGITPLHPDDVNLKRNVKSQKIPAKTTPRMSTPSNIEDLEKNENENAELDYSQSHFDS